MLFHKWSDLLAVSLSVLADEGGKRAGLVIDIIDTENNNRSVAQYTISADAASISNANQYLSSAAEDDINSIRGSETEGVFIVPVKYFDGVSEIEKFIVLSYDKDSGISLSGEIVEYDQRSLSQLCVISGNYFFAAWDEKILSVNKNTMKVVASLFPNAEEAEIPGDSTTEADSATETTE